MIWTILVAIVAIGFIIYYQVKLSRIGKTNCSSEQIIQNYESEMVCGHITRILYQMDKTTQFYTDENEASREITTSLNLLGYNATYQYKLPNNRQADVFVDNYIIEGKLEPNGVEVDRLIGQVTDYLSLPFKVIIVLYGYTDPKAMDRIMQYANNNERVRLIYLENPNRTKKYSEIAEAVA
jgi:hypothetical protein